MATLTQSQDHLAAWEAADLALSTASSYTMPGGRSLTRADGQTVRDQIAYWRRQVQQLQAIAAGAGSRHVIARFVR